ncbi:MAG: glycosyl transferase group 1 [uncultured bacterium]|nr:MAG: glycosyl transferase group 1 [uncultured bacterium]
MKKIALLHYAYPPNIGGVEILLREHAKILVEMGYQVSVITGDGEEKNPKINFVKIPEIQSILKFNPQLYEKIVEKGIVDDEFYSLVKIIQDNLESHLNKQDVIIIHNMLTLIHNLPFVYFLKNYFKKKPNKKLIVWAHDQTYIDGENILKEKQGVNLNPEEKDLLLKPINNAIYVIISETFKELLVKVMDLSKNKTFVVPDGIDLKKFLEIDDSIWKVVKEKQLLSSFPLILSPVNILYRKNLEYCFDVVFQLKKFFPNIRYIISGKVSNHRKNQGYFEGLLTQIDKLNLKENVIFLNDHFDRSLENSEIHDLYDLSDLVLFFSKGENFGLPLLEAALTSTPVFVSNLKVFKEIGGNNLFNIDSNNQTSEQTADYIKNFLETDKIIQLKKTARQKYNLETIIKEKLVPLL